eukprot:TRINITY_DN124789_c0_g1_i1.p2 TRINITY_DN124789_c0_g1~~TRINITY_DN124789_c0_g1_i1.p2  ORF type:complete len:117 (+),score=20.25 TRINITY_DN124789_c0_g1_i1:16-366(+)
MTSSSCCDIEDDGRLRTPLFVQCRSIWLPCNSLLASLWVFGLVVALAASCQACLGFTAGAASVAGAIITARKVEDWFLALSDDERDDRSNGATVWPALAVWMTGWVMGTSTRWWLS